MTEDNRGMFRLVLGTAQLGMSYGIANKSGKPDFATALAIVRTAWESGITEFDTAQAYGDSEQILGRIFKELGIVQEIKVITKLHPKKFRADEIELRQSVEQSLDRLNVSCLHGLLLHREDMLDLISDDHKEVLRGMVQNGYIRHLGVSVYSPERAKQAIKNDLIEIVQIPTSILDQRFHQAGVFTMASDLGRQIYIRSIFLQGLVLMGREDMSEKMASVKPILEKMDALSGRFHLTKRAMALIYVRDLFPQAKVIFGAETLEQIQQNVHSWKEDNPRGFLTAINDTFPKPLDEEILNPARWFH